MKLHRTLYSLTKDSASLISEVPPSAVLLPEVRDSGETADTHLLLGLFFNILI